MTDLPTTYLDSKGREHVIATMPFTYLKNAALKAERERPGEQVTLALRARLDAAEAEYAAQQAAEQGA